MHWLLVLFRPNLILYLYNYQKRVKDHINQNDEMYKMILEMYNKSKFREKEEIKDNIN